MTATLVNGQLKVTLSETETVKYNIDRVFFDKDGKQAQLALLLLLKMAAVKTAFKPNVSRFLIELYPVFEGGCEVYFIPEPNCDIDSGNNNKNAVFDFYSSEGLLQVIEFLYRDENCRRLPSTVYEYPKFYRMSVEGLSEKTYLTVLLEFADRLPKHKNEYSGSEHRRIIAKDNAIFRIGAALARH
ncbi:MAG: hypothetical protein J6S13_05870 [Clostridia bacterium]|nr:hypothetical protein [Clostridia bacterium]